jgi:hypothetical protein
MDARRLADAIMTGLDGLRAELRQELAALEQRLLELEAREAARTPPDHHIDRIRTIADDSKG